MPAEKKTKQKTRSIIRKSKSIKFTKNWTIPKLKVKCMKLIGHKNLLDS